MNEILDKITDILASEKVYKTLIAVAIGLVVYQILKVIINRINGDKFSQLFFHC